MLWVCCSLTINPLKDTWLVSSLETMMNKAAMNICVQDLCEPKFLFLWDKFLKVQLLGWMAIGCLVFQETNKLPF